MTPKREAYLEKCSNREVWLRSAIVVTKKDISYQKQRISNATEEWIATGAKCELWHKKQLLMTLRHELQRIKGMDRVVVPRIVFDCGDYSEGFCDCCGAVISKRDHDYCPCCGRRILWENRWSK